MKLAICISGLPRSFKRTYNSLDKYILSQHDCDIFISTWDFISAGSGTRVYAQDGSVEEYISLYKPKSYEVEKFTDDTLDNLFNYRSLKQKYNILPSLLPMSYKVYKTNKLRLDFEMKNFIKYDAVIRARSDLSYQSCIPNQELLRVNHGECFARTSKHHPLTPLNSPMHISDLYFLSNSENANKYSNFYLDIESVLEQTQNFIAEINLEKHLENNNIKWLHTELATELIRDE
jgi:hypothetical protein